MKSTCNSSGYDAAKVFTGGAAQQAEALKQKILSAKNTEDLYEIKGEKYYIPAGTPVSEIPLTLKPGDALLFERGGVWRLTETFFIPEGVILGAYGEGEKPVFSGSQHNFTDASLWEKETETIFKTHLPYGNVGIMVFDHSAALGVKKWEREDIQENYDYYYDYESETLFFYYDGDLSDFESIEIGTRFDLISLRSNTVADNICVKYTGAHGIVMPGGTGNITVTNCEIGFIGGSCQFRQVRFGNGIEMQLGVENILIQNNWVYQCYDAGITFQTWDSANKSTLYRNIVTTENLIEFCYYGFEFFTTNYEQTGLYSEIKNVHIDRNIFRFSGYVWSYEQRPDHLMNSHIRSRQRGWIQPLEDFTFRENIFDTSRASMIFWWWVDRKGEEPYPEKIPGVVAKGNSYYQAPMPDKRCITYAFEEPVLAEDLEGLKIAVARFDTDPKEIAWISSI